LGIAKNYVSRSSKSYLWAILMNVLILTATITPPPNAPGLSRTDPAVRLKDYTEALTFYLDYVGPTFEYILFIENSNSDLTALTRLVESKHLSERVKFISYDGLTYPPAYGRCYGEMTLLDVAMSSDFVGSLPPETCFWKLTGRYKLLNVKKMLRARRPASADLYLDLRSNGPRPWADLRVMSWTRKGYDRVLRGIGDLIREDQNEWRPGEESAFKEISQRVISAPDITSSTTFATEPLIDGVRAFDQKNWSSGRQLAVFYVRSVQRRFFGKIYV